MDESVDEGNTKKTAAKSCGLIEDIVSLNGLINLELGLSLNGHLDGGLY